MRKRTMNCLFDNVMWYLIYLMPLICYLILLVVNNGDVTLADSFNTLGLGIFTDNVVLTSLVGLFGVGGVLPLFADTGILIYFTWFISTMIAHLAVDFLLFIPRIAHKWMDKFTNDNE